MLTLFAIDHRVAETFQMSRGFPGFGVLQDRAVESDNVGALLHHRAPPCFLDVALELGAERPVIVGGTEAAVDIAGGEDEPAPFAQVHDLLHRDRALFDSAVCFWFYCGQLFLLTDYPSLMISADARP